MFDMCSKILEFTYLPSLIILTNTEALQANIKLDHLLCINIVWV